MLGPRSEPDDKTKLPLIQGRRYQGFIDGLPSDAQTNANFSVTGTQQYSAPELLKPQISAGGKTKKMVRKGKPNNTVDNLSQRSQSNRPSHHDHQYEHVPARNSSQGPSFVAQSHDRPLIELATIGQQASHEHSAKIAQSSLSMKRSKHSRNKPEKGLPEKGDMHEKLFIVQKKNEVNLSSKSYAVQAMEHAIFTKLLNQQNICDALNKHAALSKNKQPSTKTKKIRALYEQNQVHKLHEKLDKSVEYHESIIQKVSLDELYEVVDFLFYNDEQNFCPVLLEIKNEELLEKEQSNDQSADQTETNQDESMEKPKTVDDNVEGQLDKKKFLLQLWRRSDGQLLYERKLRLMPKGWGLNKDRFFYQEDDQEDKSYEIHEVRYIMEDEEGEAMTPRVHVRKIILPQAVRITQQQHENIDTEDREGVQQFHLEDNADRWSKIKDVQRLEESACDSELQESANDRAAKATKNNGRNSVAPENFISNCRKTLTEYEENECKRERKIPVNLSFVGDRIIIATQHALIEVNEKEHKKQHETQSPTENEELCSIWNIDRVQIKQIAIHGGYFFQQFIDIGLDKSAMLLENPRTNQVRFVLMTSEKYVENGKEKDKISYEILGIVQKPPNISAYGESKIQKVVTVQGKVDINDQKQQEQRIFIISLILRESGLVEVYSDFELAENFNLAYNKKHLYCVDIQADDESFYFKFLRLAPKDPNDKYEIRKVSYQWRRRITYKNSVEFKISDWESIRMKNLNQFMRLYTHFEAVQGYFIIAHRNYISVYDLTTPPHVNKEDESVNDTVGNDTKSEQEVLEKGHWREHVKMHPIHHIREICLEKDPSIKHLQEGLFDLPTHSVPFRTLHHSFKIRVILNDNSLKRYLLRDQKLTLDKGSEEQISGQIVYIQQDAKYGTGILIRTLCGTCGMTAAEKIQQNLRMMHTPISLPSPPIPKDVNSHQEESARADEQNSEDHDKDHLVFTDLSADVEQRCTMGSCYKLISINYGQLVQLWPQIESAQDAATEATKVVQQQVKSYSKDLESYKTLDTHGDIRVVNISKQFWLDKLPDLDKGSDLYLNLEEKGDARALLVYKKNDYIKLVPYLQTKQKPKISEILVNVNKNDEQSKAEIMELNKKLCADTHLQSFNQHSDTKFSFKLFPKQTIKLLDSDACNSVLQDQDLLLVRFVQTQEQEEIRLNSFVIITRVQISVFDPDKHEIARISNLQIGSAVLLDSMYIYIMEERFGNCFEQYSDKETDWELTEPKEIIRNCSKEEEGCIAINFQALFKQKFSDILVHEAATGHNGRIVRCQTNDVLCMMRNLHIVTVMPIPHWNLLSFTGMRSKSQYLIWKQSADGFFTALSKSGRLNTWSSVTGMQLWSENQNRLKDDRGPKKDCCWENIHMYEVYRSDKDDNTYLCDYFNYDNAKKPEESYSLSLLVSRNPVFKEATMAAIDNMNQKHVIRRSKSKQTTKQVFHEPDYDKSVVEALLHQTSADLIGFDEKVQKMSQAGNTALEQAAEEAQFNDHEDLPDEMFQRELDETNAKFGKCRKFTKKMRRMKLYHFQVLRLRQYDDMKRLSEIKHKSGPDITQNDTTGWWKKNYWWVPEEASGSQVEMVYHFFHKLLVKFQDKKDFEKFDWYLDNIRTRQLLYLSKDAEKMCEVIQSRTAVIWKKPETSTGKKGELITWQLDYKISKFPYIASDVCSLPYFLSDDFHFMCDYDYRQRKLRLLTTKTASLIRTLPEEALHRSENADERKNVLAALACVKVHGTDKVCTYNQQSGLYTEWPVVQKKDKKGNVRYDDDGFPMLDVRTELGISFMYKNIDIILDYNGKHMLLQPTYQMSKSSVAQRIYYRMSNFKLCMNQRKTIKHAKKGQVFLPFYYPDVYKPLIAIDYGQNISDPISMFQLDRTFTLLDWKFAELIEKSANFADMEREEQLRLIFSVFPQGNSMLQMFAQTTESEDSSVVCKMASVDDCMQLFNLASQGYNMRIDGEDIYTTFNVPLFPNCHGMQPLDYAMANKSIKKMDIKENEPRYFNSKFARLSKEEIDIINSSKNLPLVQAIFDHTQSYGFMNTCPVKSIIMAVREQLPQVFDYLNSRLTKSNLIKKVLNTEVKDEYKQQCQAWGSYGLIEVDDFSNPKLTQKDLFEKDEAGQESDEDFIFFHNKDEAKDRMKKKSQKKKLYDYYWFDVPHIWNRSTYGYQFMQALQINEDISIFQNQSIQIIVVNQWKLWWWRNFSMILAPMITQLIIFTVYTCFILTNKRNANNTLILVLEWVSLALAIYFLILEFIKMVGFCRQEHKRTLFKQTVFEMIWELASPITIIVTQLKAQYADYDDSPDDSYWELIAWTAFIFWVRFLLMLRSNEYLSPAISMVFSSFGAMGSYMVIVLIGVFAFCNTFIAIRQPAYARAGDGLDAPQDRDKIVESWQDFYDKWLTEYVDLFFELFIGAVIGLEGENGAGLTASQYILLIVALVFNTVVLMNLLLAVVGNIQSLVDESRNQYYYKMLVDQICMLQRLFFRPTDDKPKTLLFLTKTRREYEVQDTSKEELQAQAHESVMDSVTEVKFAITDLTKKINKIQQLQSQQYQGGKPGNAPFARITNNKGQVNVAEQLKKRQSNITPKSPKSGAIPAQLKKRLSSIQR